MAPFTVPDALHGQLMRNEFFPGQTNLCGVRALLNLTERRGRWRVVEKGNGFGEAHAIICDPVE